MSIKSCEVVLVLSPVIQRSFLAGLGLTFIIQSVGGPAAHELQSTGWLSQLMNPRWGASTSVDHRAAVSLKAFSASPQ